MYSTEEFENHITNIIEMNKDVETIMKKYKQSLESGLKNYIHVLKLLKEGREQEAADYIHMMCGNQGKFSSANILCVCYEMFTDPKILYHCIINVYGMDGYNFPKKVMLKAKKISKDILIEERLKDLPEGNVITIYRASSSPIEKLRTEFSWTTEECRYMVCLSF